MQLHSQKHRALKMEDQLITGDVPLQKVRKLIVRDSTCSSSSSSEATIINMYDVFLSFRGDLRHKFVSHLHKSLENVGIKAFLDEKDINQGEEIKEELKEAIANSRICMPIFSQNYASSKACLFELCHMVELNKKIIPIFYDVSPDALKLKDPKRLYEKDLDEHRDKVGSDKVEQWKKVLEIVDEIKGYDIGNKNEADEVTSITQKLLDMMPKRRDVTNKLVEVDQKEELMKLLLNLSPDDWYIVGIYGLGGIGKTTLASAIFNQLSSRFESCSFLENAREKLQSRRHKELQQQLYKDITKTRLVDQIIDRNDGVHEIKRVLGHKKILLVLDDMNDADHLESLLGHEVCFAKGSVIIVTTRDKEIVDGLSHKYKKVLDYKVEEMKKDQALRLFCRHAFKEDSPRPGYENLSEKIISYTGGLPLALKVIGSLFGGTEKDLWMKKYEQLRKYPENKIIDLMMMSYNDLTWRQQKIFLDIANYPGELHKEYACYMWEDCDWSPDSAIKVLSNRSLINVVYKDDRRIRFVNRWKVEYLWMHDVLKDVGREIVRGASEKQGGLPSRLHINGINLGDLRMKEKAYVETLSISDATITEKDMEGLCKLRFLELRHCNVEGDFKELFPNLRWLSLVRGLWMVRNFNPKNLVVFTNSRDIKPDCKGWSTIKGNKLKVLDLDFYQYISSMMPLKNFSSLEVLIIEGCLYSNELATSMSELKNLKELSIPYTVKRDSIEWIGNLTSIRKLNLLCKDELPRLSSSLTHLYIKSGTNKMRVNWGDQFELMNIVELDLSWHCLNVPYERELFKRGERSCLSFEWIGGARNLEKLYLIIPYTITNIEEVADLPRLKDLTVFYGKFQNLHHLPSSLVRLRLSCCEFSGGILDVSNLKNLKGLIIEYCDSLEELRDVSFFNGLESLMSLEIAFCPSLKCLPNLSKLRKLKRFKLHHCDEVRIIQGLAELEFLENVWILGWNSTLELTPADLDKLENAPNLSVSLKCGKLPRIIR